MRAGLVIVLIAGLALTLVFCCWPANDTTVPGPAAHPTPPLPAASELDKWALPVPASTGPVIGYVQTRDKVIVVHAGPDSPLYTVRSMNGNALAVGLSAAELSARFPELKDMVGRAIAIGDLSLSTEHLTAP